MAETAITSKADLDDQRWLDQQVATLGDGIEAARDIWSNWYDLRSVGRLHPGMSPGEYIASLGLRLTLAEGLDVMPGASSRQLAAATGASQSTASRVQRESNDSPDARVIGADGKSYPGRVVREVTAEVIEPDPDLPRGRPVKRSKNPSWWRVVSTWLKRVRPEDRRFLSELLAAVQTALSDIEKGQS